MRRWDESAASPPAVRLPWALDNTRRRPPREEAQHTEMLKRQLRICSWNRGDLSLTAPK